jgi:hypothetical protein
MAYISFQPRDFFNTVLYTGNTSTQTITGVGFSADFTWIKDRSATKWHSLVDTVRGYNKWVYSNDSVVEDTTTDRLTSWNSDGFALGANLETNTNTNDYVAWNWKAGTTSGLSGGTITPSAYSINTTSGFGAYQYTGNATSSQTIAHGLGVVPKMILIKNLTSVENWQVYHEAIGNTKNMQLDTTAAASTDTDHWQDTTPTSTVFSLGDDGSVNHAAREFIAYVFADVKGYSKFGSYKSNASTDGPFIYTGFRPAYTMIKESGGTNPWVVDDVKRETLNEMEKPLVPNNTDGTYTGSAYGIDFLSNGFKIRNNDSTYNGSSNDFIYAAFAEFPTVSSNDIPGVAR